MKKLERLKEYCIHVIFLIILGSLNFVSINPKLYFFWQPIIDNIIILVFLFFMLIHSKKWKWISKRILYSVIFILILNTYAQLFGMELLQYIKWYILPLLSIAYTITITTTINILYKLYKLWKNGQIKLF